MDNSSQLAGKLVLVTGADGGIGQAIAFELARRGAAVALHYPADAASAERTVSGIRERGGTAAAIQGDFTDYTECIRVVDEAARFLGGIDILINNAGVTERAELLNVTPEMYKRVFNINMGGQFFCAQQAVRYMQHRGGGSIVNLSSVHGYGGVPGYSVYAATKGAIAAFTRELAIELIPLRIRVNAIAPGHIEVARHFTNPNYTHEYGNSIVPWGRVGVPEDVARAAAYLVSDDADFVTGQILYVDGGTTAKLSLTPAPLHR